MATRAMVAFLDDDKQLVTTYNHFDGYPQYLGKILNKFYNDEDAAERLASEGYISYLDIDTGEINAKNQDEPGYKVIDADDAFTAGMMLGDEVKDIKVDSDLVFKKQYDKLYCYGREVNDFHTIDKQQIFALHHSGIQELSRKNDLLENKCNLLETENNNLLERTQLLEDTVSSLETLINDLTKRVKVNETTLHGMIN